MKTNNADSSTSPRKYDEHWLHGLSLLLAAVMSYAILRVCVGSLPKQNFEEFAQGELTTSIFPRRNDFPIHISDSDEFENLKAGWIARGERPVLLWLGNSQLHAINQAKTNSLPASSLLFDSLDEMGFDLLTWSLPNANLQEHYVIFEHVRHVLPVRNLILPVVFDDFRETSIRQSLTPLFDEKTKSALITTELGRRLLDSNEQIELERSEATSESFQDQSEAFLDGLASQLSEVYAARAHLRGTIFAEAYLLRNRVFGIDSQTVRKMIPGRYSLNFSALQNILSAASESGIKVIVYIAPFRKDVKSPYDKIEYAAFKKEVLSLKYSNLALLDLDPIVPGELWGQMEDIQGEGAGYDFMHFRDEGHKLLAEELRQAILQTDSQL